MKYVDQWNDSPGSRPIKDDFDPYDGCLDARMAWKDFGGLSLDSAYERFCESPEIYQEDFMFMGGAAFAYYYPVIERFILESSINDNGGESVPAIAILGHCIKTQIDAKLIRRILCQRIEELVEHVLSNVVRYSADPSEQAAIQSAWTELEIALRSA